LRVQQQTGPNTCWSIHSKIWVPFKGKEITHLVLVRTLRKKFVIWFPSDDICKPRAKLRILLVAGYLPPFEPETRIDAKTLVIEISGKA